MAARLDQTTDPTILSDLLLARRGQAYFSRKLRELTDNDLNRPSLVPGWDRRHVAAHVALHARVTADTIGALATQAQSEQPPITSREMWNTTVEFAATLPARALRHLSDHAAVHLNVQWRDFSDANWWTIITDFDRRSYPAVDTVPRRAREVWLGSLALGNGRCADLPDTLLQAVLDDAVDRVATDGIGTYVLDPTDAERSYRPQHAEPTTTIRGTTASMLSWLEGLGDHGVIAADGLPLPSIAPQLPLR